MAFKLIYLAKRNPSVPFADWPRTWRSHAVYVSQFPAVGGAIDKLHYCCRMDECPAGFSDSYDGVALVASHSRETLSGTMQPDDRALVDKDELRVFSTLVDNFSIDTEQAGSQGQGYGRAAVIRFLARGSGISPAQFDERLSGAHADLVAAAMSGAAAITHYVTDRVLGTPPAGYEYDGITQAWFASPEDALAACSDASLHPIEQDLAGFCDMDRSVSLLTRVIHEWPKS